MPPDRFRVATALPPDGGWRCELALDRAAAPPRPVVLARVPPAVSGDALALASLARGVDLASRLAHPALPQVLGLVEAGGGLAVVTPFREGDTLRAVLEGGGALTPALASRVVGEVARALQAIHGLAAAGPKAPAHGGVRAESVLVCEDGAVLLTGFGRPTDPPPLPSDDLAALPRLLAECLAPGGAGAIPPELLPLTGEVLPGDLPRSAAEFADALAAAVPPAAPGALVARVDSAIPRGAAARASRRRAIAQALLAEAGGDAGPLLGRPPGALAASPAGPLLSPPPFPPPPASSVPDVTPALTPPPIRGLQASPRSASPAPDADRAPAPVPDSNSASSTDSNPASESNRIPTSNSIPTSSPIKTSTATSRAPLASKPAPASAQIPPGTPLDDPRLHTRVAVTLALAGLVIGFLLGRR